MLAAFSAPLVYLGVLAYHIRNENLRAIGSYSKSDKSRKKFHASGLDDLITAGNSREVDKSRLDNARLTLRGLDYALSEPMAC
jgi:hypothetical protein